MSKFAANLTMMYTEIDFISRFAAAARNGFTGVEYLFPYAYPKEQLVAALQTNNLTQALHNLPVDNWASGDRGSACDPNRQAEFREGVDRAIEYARALGCRQLNCLVGTKPSGVSDEQALDAVIGNLKYAAPRLAPHGIRLLLEAVNTFDVPGFFVNNTPQALAILREVGEPNLFLQYDIYHMQMMEGNLAATIEKNLPLISHIQLADVPGRHEPGTGEIRFEFLFEHLKQIGYTGWIGCEYKPLTTTEAGLGWISAAKQASSRG